MSSFNKLNKKQLKSNVNPQSKESKPSPYSMFSNVAKDISGIPQVAYIKRNNKYQSGTEISRKPTLRDSTYSAIT
jgi:hypothetical protein